MTDKVFFNSAEFAKFLSQPCVETLRFMFQRVGGSPAPEYDLGEAGDQILIIESTINEPDILSFGELKRLRRKMDEFQAERDHLSISLKKLQKKIDQLEAQL